MQYFRKMKEVIPAVQCNYRFIPQVVVDSFPSSVEVEEGACGGFLYRPRLVIQSGHTILKTVNSKSCEEVF